VSIGSEFTQYAQSRGYTKVRDLGEGPVRIYPPTHTEYRRFKEGEDETLCLTCPVEKLRANTVGGYDVAETFERVSINQSLLGPFLKNWFEKHPTEAYLEAHLSQGMTPNGNLAWQLSDLNGAKGDDIPF
jgi:hypothetical protein